MAKQVIVLERFGEPSDMAFRFCMWATVPAGREPAYADPAATSAFKNITGPELQAIRDGQVVELVDEIKLSAGTTLAQMRVAMLARFAEFQAQITARNPWVRYGSFHDGTSSTAGGTP